MKAKRGEAASFEAARAEVSLSMGADDGAAVSPQAAGRLGRVICGGLARGPDRGQGQERACFVERVAERCRASAMADEIKQVSTLSSGGIAPLARDARRCEADEEGSAVCAIEISGKPVPSAFASMGEVAPTDFVGTLAECGGDVGGVHQADLS